MNENIKKHCIEGINHNKNFLLAALDLISKKSINDISIEDIDELIECVDYIKNDAECIKSLIE